MIFDSSDNILLCRSEIEEQYEEKMRLLHKGSHFSLLRENTNPARTSSTQNEKENKNKSKETRKQTITAEFILKTLLLNKEEYLWNENELPKGIRDDFCHIYNNTKFTTNDVNSDDNGSYFYAGTPTDSVHFDGSVAKKAHKLPDGKWIIKERVGRKYRDKQVNSSSIYLVTRAYRKLKFYPDFSGLDWWQA